MVISHESVPDFSPGIFKGFRNNVANWGDVRQLGSIRTKHLRFKKALIINARKLLLLNFLFNP